MAVRHILGFERNPAALQALQDQYRQRREIDRELGINCTVRFYTLDYGGSDSNRASIQYDYASFDEVQQAQDKRMTTQSAASPAKAKNCLNRPDMHRFRL